MDCQARLRFALKQRPQLIANHPSTLEAHWLVEMDFPLEAKKVALSALAKNPGYYVEELSADILSSAGSFALAEQLTASLG